MNVIENEETLQDMPRKLQNSCGAKNNQEATRGFLGEDDKIALETHRVSYTRAVENHLSTESRFHTLAKLPKTLQILFSLNSNFGIGGSLAKVPPPIHRGRMRLLALT
ncbi:unnamed protein product [Malus baccata var. baccata]